MNIQRPRGETFISGELFDELERASKIDPKDIVPEKNEAKLIRNLIVPSIKEIKRIVAISDIFMVPANRVINDLTDVENKKGNIFKHLNNRISKTLKVASKPLRRHAPSSEENNLAKMFFLAGLLFVTLNVASSMLKPVISSFDVRKYLAERFRIDEKAPPSSAIIQYLYDNLDQDVQSRMRVVYRTMRQFLTFVGNIFTFSGADEHVEMSDMVDGLMEELVAIFGDRVDPAHLEDLVREQYFVTLKEGSSDYNSTLLGKSNVSYKYNNQNLSQDLEIKKHIDFYLRNRNFVALFNKMVTSLRDKGLRGGAEFNRAKTDLDSIVRNSTTRAIENENRVNFYRREEVNKINIVEDFNPIFRIENGLFFKYRILTDKDDFIIPFYKFSPFELGAGFIDDYNNILSIQFSEFSPDISTVREVYELKENEAFIQIQNELIFEGKNVIETVIPKVGTENFIESTSWVRDDTQCLKDCLSEFLKSGEQISEIFRNRKEQEVEACQPSDVVPLFFFISSS